MKRALLCLAALVLVAPYAWSDCCNNDSPECACFVDGGAWDPTGMTIQDVAIATLGTQESCVNEGGKPFYQMRLGSNSTDEAQLWACFLENTPHTTVYDPDAWCSETISYWHREAGIPYSGGYQSTWDIHWQRPNTEAIRTFYMVEEASGGRGRWIDWWELDYGDFQPGVNAPVPGAYVLIRKYEDGEWNGKSHSLMINEMTIHQDVFGEVLRVEATLLEGNAGPGPGEVSASAVFDDLLSLTPAGSDSIGSQHKKILGFGIDLDRTGAPIYDPAKLHYVRPAPHERIVKTREVEVRDPFWKEYYAPLIPRLISYAKKVRPGCPVKCSSEVIKANAIPDGYGVYWSFPKNIDDLEPQGVEIMIDLLDEHPLPIIGIELGWGGGYIPQGYQVQWAGAARRFWEATVPQFDPGKLPPSSKFLLPVPITFSKSGTAVRYVRLFFPRGTFRREARLEVLRFVYNWGPGKDTEYNP